MNELIKLLNTFCLLSVLAVGGGSAVLPQMEHETVTVNHWVTPETFAAIYSLGQMAPGPNMTMVGLIGFKAAGFAGMLVVLLAFYLPSSILTYAASHVWDSLKDNPWRDAVQRGMAPITIGLMLAGVYAVGKTASIDLAKPVWFNAATVGIGLGIVVILSLRRINPAILILLSGVVGWFFLRLS